MRSAGKKIVITSTRDNFKALEARIRRRGFKAVFFPTIEIKPARFMLPRKAHDWVIFTSKNAAEHFIKKAGKKFFKDKRIAAIGQGTAGRLVQKGLRPAFTHGQAGSEYFVKEFSRRFQVPGKSFLLPVSSEAGNTIAAGLSAKGGSADILVVYKTGRPRVSTEAARAFAGKGPYYFIFFASPSAFVNFMKIRGLKNLLTTAHTAALGPATAAAMAKGGIKPDVTGKKPSFREALDKIMNYKGGEK